MSGLRAYGDLYFNRFLDGVPQGFTQIGNSNDFTITEASEEKVRPSNMRDTHGDALDTIYTRQPTSLSFSLDGVGDPDFLAMCLMGDVADLNEAAGTLSDVPITAKLGKYVDIGLHRNLSATGLNVTNASGTTTYVPGSDYEINFVLGMLKAIPDGAISADEVLHVSGTKNAIAGSKIAGGRQSFLKGAFRLDGVNQADESPIIVTVPLAVVAPAGGVNFLAKEFVSVTFNGKLTKQHGSDLYTIEPKLVMANA